MSVEEQPLEETTEPEVPEPSQLERQESVLEVPIETVAPKPKPKARGKRGPDKQPRAKPKPKARAAVAPIVEESESEESADEATLQELHSLNLLRSIRQYESQRHSRKQQLYASWFAR